MDYPKYIVNREKGQHLITAGGIPEEALEAYQRFVRKTVPSEPVIHIDDSDVVKPEGYHFESPGIVRDGSRSTPEKACTAKDTMSRKPVY